MKLHKLLGAVALAGGMVLAPLGIGVVGVANAASANDNRCKNAYFTHGKHKGEKKKHCKTTVNTTIFHPGDSGTGTSDGLLGGSVYSGTGASTPFSLGNATVDDSGTGTLNFTIPCTLETGSHTLTFNGTDEDDNAVSDAIPVTVISPANANCATVQGTQVTPSSSTSGEQARGTTSSSLPFTGSAATVMLLTLATGLIGAGAIAVTAARRRRSNV